VKNLLIVVLVVFGIVLIAALLPSPHKATPTSAAATSYPKNGLRRVIVKRVEDDLLRAGFDVQVTFVEEDDSEMIVYGKSVNRPFSRNLMAEPSFRSLLRTGKFTKITFMDSMQFPSYVQEYSLTAPPAATR